jgi:hypothetical protein
MPEKKSTGRDYPLAPTPNPTPMSDTIKGTRPGLGVFRTEKERTTVGGVAEPYKYKRESIDTTGYANGKLSFELKTQEGKGDKTGFSEKSNKSKSVPRKDVPSVLKSLKDK